MNEKLNSDIEIRIYIATLTSIRPTYFDMIW